MPPRGMSWCVRAVGLRSRRRRARWCYLNCLLPEQVPFTLGVAQRRHARAQLTQLGLRGLFRSRMQRRGLIWARSRHGSLLRGHAGLR